MQVDRRRKGSAGGALQWNFVTMTHDSHGSGASGPSHRSVEAGVAIAMIVFALIVIGGSLRAGIGWAFDGPRAGFFPFYCGLFILVASAINLFNSFAEGARGGLFAEWGQLGQVLSVVIPSAIFVAAIPWLGIYVSGALLIAFFMKWIGRYGWQMVLPITVLVPIATFLVFERWFLLPLPKGPIEELLGF
jgi:hypothetical protein